MSDFERALDTCADALREGRWTLDECLRQYPQHAAALRPQLLAILALQNTAGAAEPRAEFAADARERFLDRQRQAAGRGVRHRTRRRRSSRPRGCAS